MRRARTRSAGRGCPAMPFATTRCGSSSTPWPTTSPTSCARWPCRRRSSVPAGRGRGAAGAVRRDPAPDRSPAATAAANLGMSIGSDERRQPQQARCDHDRPRHAPRSPNAARSPEKAASAPPPGSCQPTFQPFRPCLARCNGAESALEAGIRGIPVFRWLTRAPSSLATGLKGSGRESLLR